MPHKQRLTLSAARLAAGVGGLWLAYLAAYPPAVGLGLRGTDTSRLPVLPLGVLVALPAVALLWFAWRGRLGIWDDYS